MLKYDSWQKNSAESFSREHIFSQKKAGEQHLKSLLGGTKFNIKYKKKNLDKNKGNPKIKTRIHRQIYEIIVNTLVTFIVDS